MSSLKDKTVTMAHGAGGRQTSELIDQIFAAHFANPDLTADDAAVLTPPAGKMAVSTDGFIVSPAFFPGGNIGKLSICGTVNDLACMGAKPLYLTCAFVIEEGFPMEKLEEIASAMEKTAAEAGDRSHQPQFHPGNEKPYHCAHSHPSFSPRWRMERVIGVPSRPKVFRRQFSRYRW